MVVELGLDYLDIRDCQCPQTINGHICQLLFDTPTLYDFDPVDFEAVYRYQRDSNYCSVTKNLCNQLTCNSFVRKSGKACRLGLEPGDPLLDTNASVAGIPGLRRGNVMNKRFL